MRLPKAVILMQIHFLIFDRPPQPLREDVVKTPAPAVHADPDVMFFEHGGVFLCRILAALIGIMDIWCGNHEGIV